MIIIILFLIEILISLSDQLLIYDRISQLPVILLFVILLSGSDI